MPRWLSAAPGSAALIAAVTGVTALSQLEARMVAVSGFDDEGRAVVIRVQANVS